MSGYRAAGAGGNGNHHDEGYVPGPYDRYTYNNPIPNPVSQQFHGPTSSFTNVFINPGEYSINVNFNAASPAAGRNVNPPLGITASRLQQAPVQQWTTGTQANDGLQRHPTMPRLTAVSPPGQPFPGQNQQNAGKQHTPM